MEYLGGKPLCMNQYYQILSSCRVPGPKQDSVVNFSKTKKPPTHITVVHNYQVGAPGLSPTLLQGGAGPEIRFPGVPRASPVAALPRKPGGAVGLPSLGKAMPGQPPISEP